MTSNLYKECELRRFRPSPAIEAGEAGVVERATRWLPADDAVIGARVRLSSRGGEWEIISAPEPALPGCAIRRVQPDAIDVTCDEHEDDECALAHAD